MLITNSNLDQFIDAEYQFMLYVSILYTNSITNNSIISNNL
jgi:hypothetical protein